MILKNKYILGCILCLTAATYGCKEEYVYPRVTTEFCNVKTDSEGKLHSILTDRNEEFYVYDRKGLDGFTRDSVYRCVAQYSPTEGNDSIYLYSLFGTISPKPVPLAEFLINNTEGIKRDPVTLQRIWAGERFINMVVLQMNKSIPHRYDFISERTTTDSHGHHSASIIVYHNRMNDYEAFNSEVYLSIPLDDYNRSMRDGDTLKIKITTYKGGEETRTFERKGKNWLLID